MASYPKKEEEEKKNLNLNTCDKLAAYLWHRKRGKKQFDKLRRHRKGICKFPLRYRPSSELFMICLTLKRKALWCFETLPTTRPTTERHIAKGWTLQQLQFTELLTKSNRAEPLCCSLQ
jgi:hypothetical protein